ncbi:recombinase family protein [Rhizobium sp. CFBP 13726]|uniref:recombinase family protein n=1 Tax=Rhizobium sp. CFBP 13726 TaxID=2775296 RepID=UPI001784265D|nr:recombinase family protein [Rhizobium sp. CFBP 13726]MBD8649482.1 recombinase family protein [Rhizobium sp. CFBP 13726]
MKSVRCAIYTRKSSEEGLGQEFNSLDAQREACASYIASQKHEGWVLIPDYYDDGGISGGTLERAALKRLLKDIEADLVDQIVVYKIDRLTRSLADFAKLVERLDNANASFVSVTQSFNTATSMGRLTLNVLLSFAQFEREVTAERIRDKIAASKRKGLWMGGRVPLGYEADGRSLKIVEEDAETVRKIYQLYLELGSIYEVRVAANDLGLRTKGRPRAGAKKYKQGHQTATSDTSIRSLRSDKPNPADSSKFATVDNAVPATVIGLAPFGVTNIYYILTNPVYAGRIRHRAQIHDGNHSAIIEPVVWDLVQEKLTEFASRQRGVSKIAKFAPLAGKLYDDTGDYFTPSHTKKNGERLSYYVSNRVISKKQMSKAPMDRGWRLPAKMLESQIAQAIVRHLIDRLPTDLFLTKSVTEIAQVHHRLEALAAETDKHLTLILKCLAQATIMQGQIDLVLIDQCVAELISIPLDSINPAVLAFSTSFQNRKRGVETKLIIGAAAATSRDEVLTRNIAKAQQFYEAVKQGQSFEDIAKSESLSTRRVMQIIDLAFLAPAIVQSVVAGDQPLGFTTKWLSGNPMPSDWHAQRQIVAAL